MQILTYAQFQGRHKSIIGEHDKYFFSLCFAEN